MTANRAEVSPVENLEALNSLYDIDLSKGLGELMKAKEKISELRLRKIHGELLVTADGAGLLIMGAAAAGKSRLAKALIQNHPDFKFIADDFPLVTNRGCALYGGHNPEVPNAHRFITYNADKTNAATEKSRYPIPADQLQKSFVPIKRILFLQPGAADTLEIIPFEDPLRLKQLLDASIASLEPGTGLSALPEGIKAYFVWAPKNDQGWIAQLAEEVLS